MPKTILLAGGLGTRLSEETSLKPKPMVEVGGKPMLWHIMNIYAAHGFKDFVIALGYKGEVIKSYFENFYRLNNNLSVDLATGKTTVHEITQVDWKVDLVNTGDNTQTGGRIGRLRKWVNNETFCLTYGDGVSDTNIRAAFDFHKKHGKMATVTSVRPSARFGELGIVDGRVAEFKEKPQTEQGWINGGFFILEPEIFDLIPNDQCIWEREPMEKLVKDGQLMAYQHEGFWQCMDTLREKRMLEDLWDSGKAPWKVW